MELANLMSGNICFLQVGSRSKQFFFNIIDPSGVIRNTVYIAVQLSPVEVI